MTKVSVIIAVYNSAKYLDISLPTILNQTLKDIEIICVNDGSTDNSVKLLEKYREKDSRIKIISQENKMQGAARNNGLMHAEGEYVIFFDHDDKMLPHMLETMYNKAKEFDADLVETNHTVYYTKFNRTIYPNIPNGVNIPENIPFNWKSYNSYVFMKSIFLAPWNKLVNRELLLRNKIYFSENFPGEDQIFSFKCRYYAQRAVFINQPLMIYNIIPASSVNQISTISLNLFNTLEEQRAFLKAEGVEKLFAKDFDRHCGFECAHSYYNTPDAYKRKFEKLCKKHLSSRAYKIYETSKVGQLNILQKIFSVTNKFSWEKKHKHLNVLGHHIYLGCKDTNSL